MEIKATLNKPYEEKDRLDFIVEQNHNLGYEIKETETALEAWGFTEEEKEQQAKDAKRAELIGKLDELDLKSLRALRAIQAGVGTEEDTQRIAALEEQAEEIREQLRQLGAM